MESGNRAFVYAAPATRVVFGVGTLERLGEEVDQLGARRVLLVTTGGRRVLADRVAALLGPRLAGVFGDAVVHVPVATAEAIRAAASRVGADLCVAVGGGSAVGAAKAVTLALGTPSLAVPTTYAGSEMTPIWGLTRDAAKETGRDERVRPRTVIYDPLLTLGLSPAVSGTSGLNALAHCLEALYAPDANPVTSLVAQEGVRALAAGLPRVVDAPEDVCARSEALYGAWLAGTALGTVAMGLHHKLAHALGGGFDLPHAATHAVLLPFTAAYNLPAEVPMRLFELARRVGAPRSLVEVGFPPDGLERAVRLATERPYPNPRAVTVDGVRALLTDALTGAHLSIQLLSTLSTEPE